MKMHQQFDLNFSLMGGMGRDLFTIPPFIMEELVTNLSKKGYKVLQSSAYFMDIPQSITIVKDFTGPFVSKFSTKIREDFTSVARNLGIEKLFE